MKKLTPEILRIIMPNATLSNRQIYADLINKYARQFGLVNDIQMAHYLAQVAHETGEFRYTEEIASFSAYEGRKELGNIYKGDGKKFKGRGLIPFTGRINYKAYSDYLVSTGMKVDIIKTPELLAKPLDALKSSLWICMRMLIFDKALTDDGDVITETVKDNGHTKTVTVNKTLYNITYIINGGYNGVESRQKYYSRARLVLMTQ